MPSKQLHNKVLAGGCETAKHHGPEGRNDLQKHAVPGLDVPSGKNKAIAAAGPAAAAAPAAEGMGAAQQSPSGRLRNSKTPWPWRTERPPKTCCPEAWRPFWILVKTKRLQLLGLLLLLLLLLVLLELVPNVAFWADKKPAPKCSSRALKAAPQQSPSGRLRNSKTPGPWRTERPPKTCCPGAWRPFWILVKTKRLQLLGLLLLLLLLLLVVLLELVPNVAFWTDKKPAPKRSSHGLKAAPQQSPSGRLGNSKTPWHWKTEAAPSKQAPMPNVAFWTDKKPAPKCSFHALKAAPQQSPSGRLRNSKTPWPWRTERPPKTCCPGAWRPFWILVKTKRLQLLGLLLLLLLLLVVVLLELVRNVAFWNDKKPAPKCSFHALKAAPQQSPSGRLRNSKTPWPWRTERACGHLTLPSEPTRNQLQSAAPMPSKQLHNEVLAGGCETAKHNGPEGRKRRVESNIAFWTDKKLAPKRSSHAFTAAPQRSPIARGCEKAKHHGTERRKRRPASRLQCLTLPSEATRNHLQSAAPMPSKQLHNEVLAGGCETAKHHVALKDGTTSKNMLSRGLTSLLDSGKNKAISAAGPAAAPAAAGGAAGAGAKRCLLNRQETSFKVQLPCPQSSSTTKS